LFTKVLSEGGFLKKKTFNHFLFFESSGGTAGLDEAYGRQSIDLERNEVCSGTEPHPDEPIPQKLSETLNAPKLIGSRSIDRLK